MIELQVTEREIKTSKKVDLIRGSKNYFKCKISFDDFWKDFEKTVVFKRTYGSTPFAVRVKDMISEVIIPSEVLQESGTIKIGVFGIKGDATLPTLWSEDFKVLQGSDTSGEIPEPSPTIYEELLKEISNKQDVLISGENIKTINGESILGEGDIKVQGGIEIDQTYNPKSENPQSGIAVAEAIEGLGNSWKKIVDITTTEEVNGIVATVEEFPDIAKCKEFIARVIYQKSATNEKASLGSAYFKFNNNQIPMFRFSDTTVNTSPAEQRCHCFIADNLVYSTGTEILSGISAVTANVKTIIGDRFIRNITDICYSLNTETALIPIGTQLVIYGKKIEIGSSVEEIIGDIETALDELHNYAQGIIGGAK